MNSIAHLFMAAHVDCENTVCPVCSLAFKQREIEAHVNTHFDTQNLASKCPQSTEQKQKQARLGSSNGNIPLSSAELHAHYSIICDGCGKAVVEHRWRYFTYW